MTYQLVLTPRGVDSPDRPYTEAYVEIFRCIQRFEATSSIHPKLVEASVKREEMKLTFEADSDIKWGHISQYFSQDPDLQAAVQVVPGMMFSIDIFKIEKLA